MSSWIKAEHWFHERSALLIVGERDAREVGDILRKHQDDPDFMEKKLSELINRCRPDLAGHLLWAIRFAPEKKAWEMYIAHSSLPQRKRYEESPSQRLRLDDALPWMAPTKVIANVPLFAKEVKDIKELVDATLRNYIKSEEPLKGLFPKKAVLADEPITVN